MDDEDIRDAEEAKKLSTADEYAAFGSTEEDQRRRETVMDLFRPNGETMGVKLLKKMGWKDGQGIGPKVRRSAKGDESTETHLFAPEDPQMVAFVKKADNKGLGYESEARLDHEQGPSATVEKSMTDPAVPEEEDDDVQSRLSVKRPSKIKQHSKKKGGFGVGILNDDGSDDDDPYSMGPRINYNRTISAKKKPEKLRSSLLGAPNPLLKSNPVFKSQKKAPKTDLRKCHDGRFPLDGFRLADHVHALSTLTLQDDLHKPPDVPVGWVSSKEPKAQNLEPRESEYVSITDAAKTSKLDAKSRAALLGESALPGKSVFDYLTPKARDHLAATSGKTNLPMAKGEKAPPGYEENEQEKMQSLENLVPKLDRDTALQALTRGVSGWMPYSEDERKRARYRSFLEDRAGIREGLPEKATNMSNDAWAAEMNEFARAAQVFRPVSGMMASKFTSSSSSRADLASDGAEQDRSADSLLSRPAAKPTDPVEEAAKIGMFGPLTRSIENFYPTRLLCKRFNVKPPDNVAIDPRGEPDRGMSGTQSSSTGTKFASAGFQTTNDGQDLVSKESLQQLAIASREKESSQVSERALPPVEIDAERNEALEGERPGEAVFKAIFGSDDEDE